MKSILGTGKVKKSTLYVRDNEICHIGWFPDFQIPFIRAGFVDEVMGIKAVINQDIKGWGTPFDK